MENLVRTEEGDEKKSIQGHINPDYEQRCMSGAD